MNFIVIKQIQEYVSWSYKSSSLNNESSSVLVLFSKSLSAVALFCDEYQVSELRHEASSNLVCPVLLPTKYW